MNLAANRTMAAFLISAFMLGSLGCLIFGTQMAMSMSPGQPCVGAAAAMCQSFGNHFSDWQQIASQAVPQRMLAFGLFLLALIALAALIIRQKRVSDPPERDLGLATLLLRNFTLPRPALQEALSQGILNPKLY